MLNTKICLHKKSLLRRNNVLGSERYFETAVTAMKDTFFGPFLNMRKMNSTSKCGIYIDRTGGGVGIKQGPGEWQEGRKLK